MHLTHLESEKNIEVNMFLGYNLFYHRISEITYSFEWNSLKSSWFGFDPKLCSQFRKKPFQNLLDTFIKDLSSSDFKSFWRWLVWLVSPRRFWFSFSEVSSQDKSEKIWYFDRNLKKQRGPPWWMAVWKPSDFSLFRNDMFYAGWSDPNEI